MYRFTLKLDESDVTALARLLETSAPDEARALIEAHPIYVDPVFLRKALAWSRSNPEVGRREIAFYLRHAHLVIHRSLASGAPTGTDAEGSRSAGEQPLPAPPPPPPFFEALLALLDGRLPREADAPRSPTDTIALLDDLTRTGIACTALPAYAPTRGAAWTLLLARCSPCGEEQLLARPHYLDLTAEPGHAELITKAATTNRCRRCGFHVLEALQVWIQEPPVMGDPLGSLSTIIRASAQHTIFQPPAWAYRKDLHGPLLEERAGQLMQALDASKADSSRIIVFVYSPEMLLEALTTIEREPFHMAASAILLQLEEPSASIADIEEMARNLAATLHLGPPALLPPFDEQPWRPLAYALLSEAIGEHLEYPAPERIHLALQTATCLIAVRKLEAAYIAIARAEGLLKTLPATSLGWSELADLIDAARGDVLVRQGRHLEAEPLRLKPLLRASPDGDRLERVAHWVGKAMLAAHRKKAGDYDSALALFCEAIPKLEELHAPQGSEPHAEQVEISTSGALANAAGTLLELVCESRGTVEHAEAAAALLRTFGGNAVKMTFDGVDVCLLHLARALIARALNYSLRFRHYEFIALQSERLFEISHRLGDYEHLEEFLLSAVNAGLEADCNEVVARCALQLAHHNVRTRNVDNVVNMAEVASLAAAKLSVDSGARNDGSSADYGLAACSAALAIAPLADSDARSRIALIVENQKALLTANALQIPVPRSRPEIPPELRSRYERLRAELMLLDEGEEERIPVQRELESIAAQITREINAQEIQSGYYARLVDSRPLRNIDPEAAKQLLRALGPESTLLGTFERDDRAWVYGVWSEGSEIVELEDWPTLRRDLVQLTESVARGQFPAALAERISSVVLSPLRGRLAALPSESRLVLSPYGAFQAFPFDTLVTGDGFLCEQVTLSLTLGLGTLHACLERPATATTRLLAVGAPERTTLRPPPNSRAEVRTLETLYQSRGRSVTTLLGPDATPERLATHMPASAIVHFACHAAVRDADFPSRLLLSESFETGESGIVTGDEIARSYTVAPGGLVVLAACETGRVEVSLGHDSDALVSGFLQAGASSIIATRWAVLDHATRVFMECFHERLLDDHTPATALASTVRASLRGQLGPSLTNPAVWSAFALYGR